MNFYMPVRLVTGQGCVASCADAIAGFGKKCLIVTGRNSAKKCGALDDVVSVLDAKGIWWSIYDRIQPNPTVESCLEAGRAAAESGAEFIIGIGGGSPLDAAKVTGVTAANPRLDEKSFYAKQWDNAPLSVVLVGTTAGTGSEVTKVAVLTDSTHRKHSIHDDRLYAALSLGDPVYTMSMPSAVTLSTGIDAMAHCVESYFSKKANEISRACAVKGVVTLLRVLPEALEKDAVLSIGQREDLYDASILGGLAISVTGTVFPHNVGYFLSETRSVPHGIACALFMPDLLKHAEKADPEYSAMFYSLCGTDIGTLSDLSAACIPDLSIDLSDDEIDSALPRWENNNSVRSTIGTVTTEDIRRMLRSL